MAYSVQNWYWKVAGDAARFFSSATGNYVLANDPAFAAWLAVPGNVPTNILNEAELGEVLADAIVRPQGNGILNGYRRKNARDAMRGPLGKYLFKLENRTRSIERQLVLNGSPPNLTTAAQFIAAVDGDM